MRIKYVTPFTFSEADEAKRGEQIPRELLAPDTVVDCVAAKDTGGFLLTQYEALLFDMYLTAAGLTAEQEGYDAVVMDTVSDSGLQALRSRLSIPVLGPGLVSYAVALLLGRRFSIVTVWDELKHIYEKNLDAYRLWGSCASVRSAGVRPDVEGLGGGATLFATSEQEMTARVMEAGRLAVERDRADVLVLGSTTMHQVGEQMADALGVPVVNPGPVAIKLAETIVELGLSHSKVAFPSPMLDLDLDRAFHALPAAAAGAA